MPSAAAVISRRHALGSAAAFACLSACGEGADQIRPPGEIVFSIQSAAPLAIVRRVWQPVLADMAAATGMRVKPFIAASGAAVVRAMALGRTDAGWFTNEAALDALRRARAEVFARSLGPDGAEGYQSVLLVGARSGLTLERVLRCDRTLTFGEGDPTSTAGHVVPAAYVFGERGVPPARCFRLVRTQSQDANLRAVATGALEVGVSDTRALEANRLAGREEFRQVKPIWTSLTLPEDPLIWRKSLDPAVKETLRQFFLTYGQGDTPAAARQRALLAALQCGGFQAADDTHLLVAREIEARARWAEARWSGDAARIRATRARLDAITAERLTVEARTRAPAGTQ